MSKHVHLIGIGGSGLSAIARVLKQSGWVVSGSDQLASQVTDELKREGIKICIGHSAQNIAGADTVVRSSAIQDSNPEVIEAATRGIPVMKRVDFLSLILSGKVVLAVAGTHGKTTTTSMIAWILTDLGMDPSFIVGGTVKNLGTNAKAGGGKYFVIEADEYDHMFMGLNPDTAVITNVEHDHPDCYPTPGEYGDAFHGFAASIKKGGHLLMNADLSYSNEFLSPVKHLGVSPLTFGENHQADFRIMNPSLDTMTGFTLTSRDGKEAASVQLTLPGMHNIWNAAAAMVACSTIGIPLKKSASSLGNFIESGRRFDLLGTFSGTTLIDDYAHHPTEIQATLQAARIRYPSARIWAVWQPHTYSRTRLLESEFSSAFSSADKVIVTEIFASREKPQDYSAANVVNHTPGNKAIHIPGLDEVITYLFENVTPGDVVLVLSAGDADRINRELSVQLSERK